MPIRTHVRLSLAAGLLAVPFLVSSTLAQDMGRIAPQQPPAPPAAQPPAPPEPSSLNADDSRVILPELKGLVFLSGADQVSASPATTTGVSSTAVPLLNAPDFRADIEPYLGAKPFTFGSLNQIIKATILYYRRHDHPLVDVVVPQQDVSGGVVQIVIIEFKAGEIRAEGNTWFSSDSLISAVRTQPGGDVVGSDLMDDVDWLNRNPFRHVDLVYQRSNQLGRSDVVLRTQDRFPAQAYLGYANNGNQATGVDRSMAGFTLGDLFGMGHILNYQATSSSDVFPRFNGGRPRYLANAATYTVPLPWRDQIVLSGAYVISNPQEVGNTLFQSGKNWQVSGRYQTDLPRIQDYREQLSFGVDFKRLNNNLDFGGLSIYANDIDIFQGAIEYSGAMPDQYGKTGISLSLYLSPGDVTSNNTASAFTAGGGRAGSRPNYVYGQLGLERLTDLPYGFSLYANGRLQESSGALQSSEQLGLGGVGSVRGYVDRSANGDNGLILSTELRLPSINVLGQGFDVADSLVPYAFFDAGRVWYSNDVTGEPGGTTLDSTGVGLRYNLPPYATVSLDYAVPLTHITTTSVAGEKRWQLNASIGF